MIRSRYMGRYPVFREDKDFLDIFVEFISNEMRKIGWNITTYAVVNSTAIFYGIYPKDKIVEIKKFFYDIYPYVSIVEPRKYGIRIHFNKKIFLLLNDYGI